MCVLPGDPPDVTGDVAHGDQTAEQQSQKNLECELDPGDRRQRLSLPAVSTAARPASRRATGTRNGEQETQSRPTRGKKRTDSRSPPCPPHTPTLRSGRVLRPSSVAISTSRPMPSASSVSNGLTPKMPRSM